VSSIDPTLNTGEAVESYFKSEISRSKAEGVVETFLSALSYKFGPINKDLELKIIKSHDKVILVSLVDEVSNFKSADEVLKYL
jgi:hypothetical protein